MVVSFLVDVSLGMLLVWWLYRDEHISMLANALLPAAEVRLPLCGADGSLAVKRKLNKAVADERCGSSSACGEGAGGAAAVADGSSRWAEDEPGPGPGPGSLLPLSHPPVDQ